MHCGYVVKVEKLRKHENADRLQIATFFGNDTIVSMDTKIGHIGVYFPSDLQLSEEYCAHNNLVRKKDENGNEIGGYLDPDKRNIKAIKLRGEKSDGVFMPITSFAYCWDIDLNDGAERPPFASTVPLKVGDTITVVNGHEICCKYIPKTNHRRGTPSEGNKTRKKRVDVAPLFAEHADTEQLAYNLGAFKVGDEIEITLKMHGTSQRTGYLPVHKGYRRTLLDRIFRRPGKPIYEYDYVCGTRRVVLDSFDKDGGFYGNNSFRKAHHDAFVGKLVKGETVYYEVVGFTDTGAPIMGNGSNDKLGKDFVKQYGKETVFSYGCAPNGVGYYLDEEHNQIGVENALPQSDLYVYRMTMTNEDGFVVEYTPDFMRYRCEQMGVKAVKVFGKGTISPDRLHFIEPDGTDHDYRIDAEKETVGDQVASVADVYNFGPDPVGKTHIREGVVVRIINRPKFCAYKSKNFEFKVLEGLIKDTADAPDMEEAQDVQDIAE